MRAPLIDAMPVVTEFSRRGYAARARGNSALVAVERGEWELRDVYCTQPGLSFSGSVFGYVG